MRQQLLSLRLNFVMNLAFDTRRLREAYQRRKGRQSPGPVYTDTETELRAVLGPMCFDDKMILDLGCSWGAWIRRFVKWGAKPENIYGVDLRPNAIKAVRRLRAKGYVAHGAALPFRDATFDLAFAMLVFTSILDSDIRCAVAEEMVRVTKPGGIIILYDFYINNPFNPDVRALTKDEIHKIFRGHIIRVRRTTLAPPLARFIGNYSLAVCRWLTTIPILNTHYITTVIR